MKLLKKLAILTCALAAFSFVACDSGSSDDDEPNTPVVDEGGEEAGGEEPSKATITVAVTADESQVADFGEAVYAYLYNEAAPANGEVFGGWPGKQLSKNDELGIWSVTENVSSDSLSYSVIFNNNGGKQFNASSITVNESKLYTHARTWIDWDGTSADTTEAYVAPVAPTAMSSEIIAFAVDASDLAWDAAVDHYFWAWGGTWDDNSNAEVSPLKDKSATSDEMKLTNLEGTNIYYITFLKKFTSVAGLHIKFIKDSNDKPEEATEADISSAVEAGKGYLLKDGTWTTFTSFDELKSE